MTRAAGRLWLVGAAFAALSLAAPVHAQPKDEPASGEAASEAAASEAAGRDRRTARAMGEEGVKAYQRGAYEDALENLEVAYRLAPVPKIGLWTARTLDKLGRLTKAEARYREVIDMKLSDVAATLARLKSDTLSPEGLDAHKQAQTVAKQEHEALLLRMPKPVPPNGPATEDEERPAARPRERPSRAMPAQGIAGWSAVALGGAGIIIGAATGGAALAKKDELDCIDDACPPSQHDAVDEYETLRITSTVGFWGGGGLAAIGLVLLVTMPPDDDASETAGVEPMLGFGMAGVRGRF